MLSRGERFCFLRLLALFSAPAFARLAMNLHPTIPPPWSRQRWAAVTALIVAVKVSLLFLFSEKSPAVSRAPASGTTISLVLDPVASEHVLEILGANDPTLFALASPRSFSGKGWLNPPPRQHRLQEWTEPDLELSQPSPAGTRALAVFLRTNLSGMEISAEKLAPDLRSLARPLLVLPLLTTNLSPPEASRPQVAQSRATPGWSPLDSREPVAWLAPRSGAIGGVLTGANQTNFPAVRSPSNTAQLPGSVRPPASLPIPTKPAVAPRLEPAAPAAPPAPKSATRGVASFRA